ncbi:unnamed protein product [Caenorhabditis angaria]|uniref:Annexin n=1 Tax=Caenorhabditis angaria TaxID=860376 RepID=A0A9P1ISU2_9PELO|nr:unnamed protein product [Caenorhabditis angaria]
MLKILFLLLCAFDIPNIILGSNSDESESESGELELEPAKDNPLSHENLLYKSIIAFPYDEPVFIAYFYGRTYEERLEMIKNFRKKYGDDGFNKLKDKLKGVPETLRIVVPTVYYDARLLNLALQNRDNDWLMEVMVSRTSQEIREIKKTYEQKWNNNLCKAIDRNNIGDFERILLALCAADRDESDVVDEKLADSDCFKLYEYGPATIAGTNEEGINGILFKRNYKQLRRMFEKFSDYEYSTSLEKRTIETMIDEEYSFCSKAALLKYVQAVKSLPEFFASSLKKSLTESNEKKLIRIIMSRAGVDLPEIAEAFGGKEELSEQIAISAFTSSFTRNALRSFIRVNG